MVGEQYEGHVTCTHYVGSLVYICTVCDRARHRTEILLYVGGPDGLALVPPLPSLLMGHVYIAALEIDKYESITPKLSTH